jgi:hypothetical protein
VASAFQANLAFARLKARAPSCGLEREALAERLFQNNSGCSALARDATIAALASGPAPSQQVDRAWLAVGLFLTTFATLLLEILDSRLLSVITWYHLSFFAVSLAMLGMAGGAVFVFVGAPFQSRANVPVLLGRAALAGALVVPLSHLFNLSIVYPPLGSGWIMLAVPLATTTIALALPFIASGVVVTLALTRTGNAIGWLYGWDLLGAGAGALLVVPLLNTLNISSAVFVAGAAAAAGAAAFARVARGSARPAAVLTIVLAAAALWNGNGHDRITVRYAKNRWLPAAADIDKAQWNSHAYIVLQRPRRFPPAYWGRGAAASDQPRNQAWMNIDGEAGTVMTEWHGDRAALDWIRHDVTVLPHYFRQGDAGIIGVGGGRDILSAIWAGHRTITGIEINSILIDTLSRDHRSFAGIADYPGVRLVHDEARSYLSRARARFDVLQMSLIDTWAATGAGAFTLTENGLYTREAWRVFLDALAPGGVFSVSRWFSPSSVSEANRLLALGVAALLDRHVANARRHLVLVSRDHVATLLVSNAPFTDADAATLARVAGEDEFDRLVDPWSTAANERLARIAASRTFDELRAASADPDFDYSPPDDERPYFFNLLKLRSVGRVDVLTRNAGLIIGNLYATATLAILCVVAAALVAAIIVWPLLRVGRPAMSPADFAAAVAYFSAIGAGYMFIQVAFLQRFSVLLGHPTYTFAIILFSMIVFTGAGSFLSDRLSIDETRRIAWIPIAIAVALAVALAALKPAFAASVERNLFGRTCAVLAFTAPISTLLGFCFPIGMRLVGQRSTTVTAWMWGVNGACGVLASVLAVAVSMWIGIDVNLMIAAALYLLLLVPMLRLQSSARLSRDLRRRSARLAGRETLA